MLGVSTIGNATLIAYDEGPILATDPWFGDENPAYFGSWGLTHQIPADCKSDILKAKYIWFSHGHPDHLNAASLEQLRGKNILLGDHVGDRIAFDLREQGFDVTILPDRQWVDLSANLRVFCITTVIQDSILLVELNNRIFVNLNDAGSRACNRLIRKMVTDYRHSYLLTLSGYGDADMINCYDEDGTFIVPAAAIKFPVGKQLSNAARGLGIRSVIPFSSFHAYQRSDSQWAEKYVTPLDAYSNEFDHENHEYIPPFVHIDCQTGEATALNPSLNAKVIQPPELFGDNWGDVLEPSDLAEITEYFRRKDLVRDRFSFINFRVGGRDNFVQLDGKNGCGITFEVPRNSLMTAIKYEIFDDLLIGNFMKTTFHKIRSLYDGDFSFAVAKYGDNGRVNSYQELHDYFKEYRRRAGRTDWYWERASQMVTAYLPRESPMYRIARQFYWMLRP
jgi:hypothetical protein